MISTLLSLALAATSANAVGDAPAKPAKPRKICEKVEVTGSRVSQRICRTVEAPKPKDEAAQTSPEKTATTETN